MEEGDERELSIKGGQGEFYDWRCKVCKEKGVMKKAVFFCRNCDVCFCSSCLQYHNRCNKQHEILGEKAKVDWGKPELIQDKGTDCSDHPGQTISMHCEQHDDPCCPVCAVLKHSERCKLKKLKENIITEVNRKDDAEDKKVKEDIEKCAIANKELQDAKHQMKPAGFAGVSLLYVRKKYSRGTLTKYENISETLPALHSPVFEFANISLMQIFAQSAQRLGECVEGKQKPRKMESELAGEDVGMLQDTMRAMSDEKERETESLHKEMTDKSPEPTDETTLVTTSAAKEKVCGICNGKLNKTQVLDCGHEFCTSCIQQTLTIKQACPTCGERAVLTGDQPGGTIEVHFYSEEIVITFQFPPGIQERHHPHPGKPYRGMECKAYLPANREGKVVFKLVKIAFHRGLLFTIKASETAKGEDAVTWNVVCLATKFLWLEGFPPSYLDKVKAELAVKGVTEKDIRFEVFGALLPKLF